MVFGGVEQERLQLNEDTLWAGGPTIRSTRRRTAALPEVRRLIVAGKFAEAQALANAQGHGEPLAQMPYQPSAT